jgi:phosphoribosylformylglycinamidine synthase
VSKGGLAVALAEACITGALHGDKPVGAYVELQSDIRVDSLLFGETQSRIIVTVARKDLQKMKTIARAGRVVLTELGKTGGSRLIIEVDWASKKCSRKLNLTLDEIEKLWKNTVNEHE